MEDFDFDKHYADKMQQASAPDFSQEDWEKLTPRLEASKKRRPLVTSPILLYLLGGLLLLSNITWWVIWQQPEQRDNTLLTGTTTGGTVVLQDTTWNRVVVYQYDTVRETVVLPNQSTRFSPAIAKSRGVKNNTALPGDIGLTSRHVSLPGTSGASVQVITGAENSITENKNDIYTNSTESLLTEALPERSLLLNKPGKYLNLAAYDLFLMPLKPAKRPYLSIPLDVRIGPELSFVLPDADDLSSRIGFSTGLNAELALSEKLAFTLAGEFIGVSFKGREYDPGLGLPELISPGDDYEFNYFELHDGIKPIIQMTAGMKYWFNPSRKISPYMGLGYASQWHLPYEIEVEYNHLVTGLEWSTHIEAPALDNPVSLLDINAGIRYRVSPHWLWQTGVFFQFKIDPAQAGIPRYWGIKSVMLYEF